MVLHSYWPRTRRAQGTCNLDDFGASPAVHLLQAFTSMQREALPAGIKNTPLEGLDAQETGSDMQQLPVYGSPYARHQETGSDMQQLPVYGSAYARHRAASRAEQEAAAENASDLQSEELAGQLQQVWQTITIMWTPLLMFVGSSQASSW